MALDPQIQTFLDNMALMDQPGIPDQPVDLVRAGYEALGSMTPVPDAVVTTDLLIPGPDGELGARIYRASDEAAPGVVYFHGGGHVIGSLTTHDGPCGLLARDSGCAVISVDYRLAPEHPFPADVDDCLTATTWIAAHADELGLLPDRLAVAGDSAGGNLAAVVARRARDAGGPALAGQLLLYPWVDLSCDRPSMTANAIGKFMQRADLEFWVGLYAGGDPSVATHPDGSALHADDLSGLPPAIVVTAGGDPLHDQGCAYAEALAGAGTRARHLDHEDLIHAFIQVTPLSERAAAATTEVARELGRLLTA